MAKILRAGVVGDPVEHSLSPEIFNYLSRKFGFPLDYRRYRIPSARLQAEWAQARRTFRGWNVTLPLKEKTAQLVDQCAPEAELLGAVNVVKFGRSGARGYNTDVLGIRKTLHKHRFLGRGKKAVVFGAGGAASAVLYALGLEGLAEVFVINRSADRAKKLCRRFQRHFKETRFSVTFEAPEDADLYVNATSLGMKGKPPSPKLPSSLKKKGSRKILAFDLVYQPLQTGFLVSAKQRGFRCAHGLTMLVAQALGTWEIWFGPIPKSVDRAKLQSGLERYLLRRLNSTIDRRLG